MQLRLTLWCNAEAWDEGADDVPHDGAGWRAGLTGLLTRQFLLLCHSVSMLIVAALLKKITEIIIWRSPRVVCVCSVCPMLGHLALRSTQTLPPPTAGLDWRNSRSVRVTARPGRHSSHWELSGALSWPACAVTSSPGLCVSMSPSHCQLHINRFTSVLGPPFSRSGPQPLWGPGSVCRMARSWVRGEIQSSVLT